MYPQEKNVKEYQQRMETCFLYGTMMIKLHLRISLKQLKTLTSSIVLG